MPTPAQQAGWRRITVALFTIAAGILAIVAGVVSLYLAMCSNHFAALVALVLSIGWGAMATTLVASAFSTNRIEAETRARVVEDIVNRFVRELANGDNDTRQHAELIDRLHALASTAITRP